MKIVWMCEWLSLRQRREKNQLILSSSSYFVRPSRILLQLSTVSLVKIWVCGQKLWIGLFCMNFKKQNKLASLLTVVLKEKYTAGRGGSGQARWLK